MAQLEQKTNQFNLTTRRYSEAAIRAFLSRDDAVVLAFRLADRFGDHGLTSTLIALREGDALAHRQLADELPHLLAHAEAFILRGLLEIAREWGVRRLVGEYVATAKNGVVADLYGRLGFEGLGDGVWERRPIDEVVCLRTHIVAEAGRRTG